MSLWIVRRVRGMKARDKRLLVYFAVFLIIAAWGFMPRIWVPKVRLETDHYAITSSATPAQTREIALVAEIVYDGYGRLLGQWHREVRPHPKLKVKLFKDRREFRRCNRVWGWAEGFYRKPYCYQYYSADELHPYHWMMHEAVHQLNEEAARLTLPRWLDEGIADYVATSRIVDDSLRLGEIDTNTYPIWWLDLLATSGNLDADKANGSVIPLRAIVSGRGGPSMNRCFNLYYLHWWSLTHFLMEYEGGVYREGLGRLVAAGASLTDFEKHVGPVDSVERQWYAHVLDLKKRLSRQVTPPVSLRGQGGA
jgi:hypothetical protein